MSNGFKFVVLEGIVDANLGNRFWTSNRDEDANMTKLNTGEEVYRVILYTDDEIEACAESMRVSYETAKALFYLTPRPDVVSSFHHQQN